LFISRPGPSQNLTKASEDYELAARQGNALAQRNYGNCLYNGEGFPQNMAKAAEYYKLSADNLDGNCFI
jgi:TPR repeat protein